MPRGRPENLIKNSDRTPEELKAQTSRAGKASVAARRRKKTMRELAEIIGSMPQRGGNIDDIANVESLADIKDKNLTALTGVVLKLYQRAMQGNVRAAEQLMNLLGENPALKLETTPDTNLKIRIDYGEKEK